MIKKMVVPLVLPVVAAFCVVAHAGLIFSLGFHAFWPPGLSPKGWSNDLQPPPERTTRRGWFFQYDDVRETLFEIQFNNRDDFERIWPAILSLKSKGAPLTLKKGATSYRQQDSVARGVQILYPLRHQKGLSKPGIDPNTLAQFLQSTDTPPEYIEIEGGRPKPFTGMLPSPLSGVLTKLTKPVYRARTDLILVVDGNVVDLNRISLPADTPIIDQRFAARK